MQKKRKPAQGQEEVQPREKSAQSSVKVWLSKGWVRQGLIMLISLAIVIGIFFTVAGFVENKYIAPADESADYFVEITIPNGSSVSKIARILEEQGIIRNRTAFKLSVDLMEMGNKLRSGTYYLSPSMTTETILDILSSGSKTDGTIRVTIVEGKTVEEIANQLVEVGLLSNTSNFLKLCNEPETFSEYSFINSMTEETLSGKRYALEGYLFPDTYEYYANASEETIIRKMLDRFNQIYNAEIVQKAEELNMTTDQVITLASMIEKEAKEDDFTKVSAVFHNRLEEGMRLESCPTVQYAKGIKNLVLSEEDMAIDSPYNTYKYRGLPAGAVCNPGQKAIEAAVNPDQDMIDEGYYYFCLTDPATGVLQFSKTLEEHNVAKAEWQPLWLEYDAKNAEN